MPRFDYTEICTDICRIKLNGNIVIEISWKSAKTIKYAEFFFFLKDSRGGWEGGNIGWIM